MDEVSFQEITRSVTPLHLEQFQNELHLFTKLLVAKHFSDFDQINMKGAYKLDDWIWDNSQRLTTEISELLETYSS